MHNYLRSKTFYPFQQQICVKADFLNIFQQTILQQIKLTKFYYNVIVLSSI